MWLEVADSFVCLGEKRVVYTFIDKILIANPSVAYQTPNLPGLCIRKLAQTG